MIRPESPENDITATSRTRTSGSFRLIHIDEYGVNQAVAGWRHTTKVSRGYNRGQ
jgi:hypothetical protein